MLKLISKALFLILISANVMAKEHEEYLDIELSTYDHISEARTVVEVLGSSKGSGVLADFDGRAVIVTNSHNLQGNMSAMVTLPAQSVRYYLTQPTYKSKNIILQFKGISKVLYDFPLSDVAILELPEGMNLELKSVVYTLAKANGTFTKEGWIPGRSAYEFADHVLAVLQGKANATRALAGFTGTTTPDIFISGDGNPIWAIPIFTKPGVSGGGYYRQGLLTGLVTKISLAGESLALATPFTKIAKLLYSPDPIEKKVTWENSLMVYKEQNKTIAMNPLSSGAIGNGGELETIIDESHSGDSNPNYWRLEVLSSRSKSIITTWDPFAYRQSQFKVNQDNISFVKTKTKSLFKTTEAFHIPTIANVIANEKKSVEQTFMANTPQNLALLKEARLKQKTNINYGRIYTNSYEKNLYKIYNFRYNSTDGSQLLKPMSKERWAPKQNYNSWLGPKPIFDLDAGVSVDPDGYFSNSPFSTKFSDNTIFDIKITGNLMGNHKATAFITGPTDLSKITLKLVELGQVTEIILKPEEVNSPNSIVFKSDNGAYRAIYMYTNDNLSQLVKIFIVSEDALIELWMNQL